MQTEKTAAPKPLDAPPLEVILAALVYVALAVFALSLLLFFSTENEPGINKIFKAVIVLGGGYMARMIWNRQPAARTLALTAQVIYLISKLVSGFGIGYAFQTNELVMIAAALFATLCLTTPRAKKAFQVQPTPEQKPKP